MEAMWFKVKQTARASVTTDHACAVLTTTLAQLLGWDHISFPGEMYLQTKLTVHSHGLVGTSECLYLGTLYNVLGNIYNGGVIQMTI